MIEDHATHHAQLDWLRANAPAYRDEAGRCVLLTRYDDVRGYLLERHSKDPDLAEPGTFLAKSGKPTNPERPGDPASIGYMDGADHERVRKAIAKPLYKRIAQARPLVEEIVAQKLERLQVDSTFDVMSMFAEPAPTEIFARMLGVDESDLPRFRRWAQASFKIFSTDRTVEQSFAMNAANEALSSWLDSAMEERRRDLRDDLISDLIQVQRSGATLSDGEVRANCISLVVASIMTTSDLIGSGLLLLLRHPEEMRKLRSDPDLIRPAVEEMLRLEPPIESEWRVALTDLELAGCPVRKRQVVAVSLDGANRDPHVFEDPHKFSITRPSRPHLSFGAGEHICLGAPLGRLTTQVAIGAFVNRFPHVRLAPGDDAALWRKTPFFRGLEHLRVVV